MRQLKDIEQAMQFTEDALINKLNSCITKINTEKSDAIALETFSLSTQAEIDKTIYWDLDEPPEYSKFIWIKLQPVLETETVGNLTSKQVIIQVELFFTISDVGNNKKDYVRGLRYLEAMERAYKNQALELGIVLRSLIPLTSSFAGAQRIQTGIELSFNFS